jgi:enamine deaminase RidA (YjgF/YER057c/UK114 family)
VPPAPEQRLLELGIDLPAAPPPVALYQPAVRTGNLLFVSGAGSQRLDGSLVLGKVGAQLDLDAGREAARLTGLALLARIREAAGSLDHVTQAVKLLGMVNVAPGFVQVPQVIDGCSQLLIDVFGDPRGRGARSAVGMAELPMGIAVEIEAIVELAG